MPHLQGASFEVHGHLVRWQRWQLRIGFNYREGVVLHDVAFQDGDRLRPVLARMSLVEMAVPYADPRCDPAVCCQSWLGPCHGPKVLPDAAIETAGICCPC
jgi:Cu2+-containing amine oxidase